VNILLINNNPVVSKLATLSSQKTSDELEIVEDIEDIATDKYDLLAIDDGIYSDELMEELKEKIQFTKSLFICSKKAEPEDGFSATIKKPFLPTDLVELFVKLATESDITNLGDKDKKSDDLDKIKSEDSLDSELENISLDDELDFEENEAEDMGDITLDDDFDLEDQDSDLIDDITLDDEISLDDELPSGDDLKEDEDEDAKNSVLDKDELQEVQELLDETDELELENELELDDENTNLENEPIDEDVSEETIDTEEEKVDDSEFADLLDEDVGENEDIILESAGDELEEELEEEIPFDDKLESKTEDSEHHEEEPEDVLAGIEIDDDFEKQEDVEDEVVFDDDLESQIEDAVSELSDEDLNREVDEETLVDIVTNEMDDFDNLTSKDIKLAIGEDIEDDENAVSEIEDIEPETVSVNDGVEQLRKLLEVLSDKNIAASLKGAKINISITLGEK
jgi:uncharacterized membrane protein